MLNQRSFKKPRRNIDRPTHTDTSLRIRVGSYKRKQFTNISVGSVAIALVATAIVFFTSKLQQPIALSSNQIDVCFTPQQSCRPLLLSYVQKAQKSIYVQAYSFTSKPIASALLDAHRRGVKIIVIADKAQRTDRYTQVKVLQQSGIQ
jgi:phosphatidylserine/phosphatidylglycerophosphate/cardiolipin synthase-like enzyme